MSKTSKILHKIHTGDLIFIAASKQNPVEWIDVALIYNHDVFRTIQLGDGNSKTIRQSTAEYLEHEYRPIGVFRHFHMALEERELLAKTIVHVFDKPLSFWMKVYSFFKKPVKEFNWNNQQSIKPLLLKHFKQESVKQWEESGMLVRLI
jgi:hypothetical protein